MTIVEDDFRGVPFSCRVELSCIKVRNIHGVINSAALPLLKRVSIDLLPILIVNELVFRPGYVRNLEGRVLNYMIEHAAVTSAGDFPLPFKIEIGVFLVGNDVTACIASFAFCEDTPILDFPGAGQLSAAEIPPTVE